MNSQGTKLLASDQWPWLFIVETTSYLYLYVLLQWL